MQLGQSSRDLAEPGNFEATDDVDETDDEKYRFASYAKISTTAWIRSVDSISQATDPQSEINLGRSVYHSSTARERT